MGETPLPGRAVRGSESGRPIMALLDLVGRRWALRVLWELRGGALSFRDLQEVCGGLSSSVLRDRLGELREARVVGHEPGAGYALTPLGRSLMGAFEPLRAWSEEWAQALSGADAGPPGSGEG